MSVLTFTTSTGEHRRVAVEHVFNAGYAGRDSDSVRHHIEELAGLGVPGPGQVPTLYPLSSYLVTQAAVVQAPHTRTSGEAEWAIVVGDSLDDVLLTAACDHTDRDLEVHGVAWSKQSAPDVLGDVAWPLSDVHDRLDAFELRAWVEHDGAESLIQDGSPAQLLPPDYWLRRLADASLLCPRTVLLSGTIPMIAGVDQFADRWRVELSDPHGTTSTVSYSTDLLPPAWS